MPEKSELYGATVSVLSVLLAAFALAGPRLFNLHPPPSSYSILASHISPSIKVGLDLKVINQALSGCSVGCKAQSKALLDSQSRYSEMALQQVVQRADAAQAQADKWEDEVKVLHAQQEADAKDKRVHLIMMVVLTGAAAVLILVALRSKSMPDWAKDIAKTAAGAIIAAWFK